MTLKLHIRGALLVVAQLLPAHVEQVLTPSCTDQTQGQRPGDLISLATLTNFPYSVCTYTNVFVCLSKTSLSHLISLSLSLSVIFLFCFSFPLCVSHSLAISSSFASLYLFCSLALSLSDSPFHPLSLPISLSLSLSPSYFPSYFSPPSFTFSFHSFLSYEPPPPFF